MKTMSAKHGTEIPIPTARHAELALVGAVMVDRAALDVALARGVGASDFGEADLRTLWQLVERAMSDGHAPAPQVLVTYGADPALVAEAVAAAAGGAAFADSYAEAVLDAAARRRYILTALETAAAVSKRTMAVQEALGRLSEVSAGRNARNELELIREADVDALLHTGHQGVPTGLQHLDIATAGGLYRDLNILMARPSMGKTITALQIAHHVAERGGRVLFVSMDTPRQNMIWRQVVRYIAYGTGRVPSIQDVQREPERWRGLIDDAKRWVARLPISWRFGHAGVHQVRLNARRLWAGGDLALVVVDYIQQLQAPGETEYERTTITSRLLKELAMDLEVPVLGLAQLSRATETRANKRPMLSDLRQTGQLEQDAALVFGLFRPGYYDPKADQYAGEILLLKQKDGPVGTISARWVPGWGYETLAFQQR